MVIALAMTPRRRPPLFADPGLAKACHDAPIDCDSCGASGTSRCGARRASAEEGVWRALTPRPVHTRPLGAACEPTPPRACMALEFTQ